MTPMKNGENGGFNIYDFLRFLRKNELILKEKS